MTQKKPNRESVTTISQDGSRYFLYPADVKGPFMLLRRLSAIVLIGIYVALPHITINNYPAVFLDLTNLRLHLFGITLASQDFWLMFFLITGLAFSLFFVTALFGRLWCSVACPQTVFLEHVYRRIERFLEGDAFKRKRLAEAPWDSHKATIQIIKHGLYILVSLIIANIFLSYFVSFDVLVAWMHESPLHHLKAFLLTVTITALLYFNFAWFREQLCIVICPYGRLQSALVDDDTIIVGYDSNRGEPRGKVTDPNAGDCIDCSRCVQVCPTGIDIRQGLQMECIGCAACIDACNEIMQKVKRPKGLIRFDSYNGLCGNKKRFFRPRIFMYTFLLLVGTFVMLKSVTGIKPAEMNAIRMLGGPYFISQTHIRNQYMVRIVNKTNQPKYFVLKTQATALTPIEQAGFEKPLELEPMAEIQKPLVILQTLENYQGPFDIDLILQEDGNQAYKIHSQVEFLGPDPKLLKENAP